MLPRTKKQQSHYIRDMMDPIKKRFPKKDVTGKEFIKKNFGIGKAIEMRKS